MADIEIAFFLVRGQAEATMVELEVNFKENDKRHHSRHLRRFSFPTSFM
jgi:hypothetical protein